MKVAKTSEGLSKVLFDELEDLCNGKSTPQMARAKAHLAGSVISIKRLEMDFAKFADEKTALKRTNIKMLS